MSVHKHRWAVGGMVLAAILVAGCVGSQATDSGSPSGSVTPPTPAPSSPTSPSMPSTAQPSAISSSPAAVPSFPVPPGWRSTLVPGLDWGPLLAVSNHRLFMSGMDEGRNTILWQSSDGLLWQRMGDTGIAKDFVPRDMTVDAKGALILVGELTTSESPVPQIWRSTNGRTFTQANVEPPFDSMKVPKGTSAGGEIVGIAVGNGTSVAFGDHVLSSSDKSVGEQRTLDVWHSTDGVAWQHVDLPASSSFDARSITVWQGGFAALASGGAKNHDAVWLSKDGATWQRSADIAQFSTGPILALRDRLVVLGYAETSGGPAPAAWRSTDGRTWTQSLAPFDGIGVMLDGGVVAEDRLVVVGMSHVAVAADDQSAATPTLASPHGTAPATPTAAPTYKTMGSTFWVSSDASTWRIAGPAPYYQPYQFDFVSFDGRLIAATRWPGGAMVSVGAIP